MSLIEDAWCRDTSADPDNWTPENPAWGQCAVTALVVQDLLGGSLQRGTVDGHSHYWVLLPDGWGLDLTMKQFGPRKTPVGCAERDRDYVLSFSDTARRYHLLRERVFGGTA